MTQKTPYHFAHNSPEWVVIKQGANRHRDDSFRRLARCANPRRANDSGNGPEAFARRDGVRKRGHQTVCKPLIRF